MQVHIRMAVVGVPSVQDHAQSALTVAELNDRLRKTVQTEHAAYCAFVAGESRGAALSFSLLLWPFAVRGREAHRLLRLCGG